MTTQAATAYSLDKAGFSEYPQFQDDARYEFEPLLEHLAITPISAFHYHCSAEWKLVKRTLPNSYWSLIIAGEGELMLKSRKLQVKTGQLLLFPARMEHALTPLAGSCMSMINIHFQARIYNLIDICSLLGLSGIFADETGSFTELSRKCAKLYALKPPGWKSYFEALIRVQLFDLILNSVKKLDSVTPELKKLSRIYPALELVENRFTDYELAAKDLAEKLNISQVYSRKLFNDLFGISPIRFIHNRRIEYACTLLRETELPIKTIAAQSGFNDLAFFYRIFARSMNLTPAKYRQTPQF
jgi:AraC-like DNA-binding protein